MKLPEDILEQFRAHGRRGGKARARRMSPEARQAVAHRAAASRWIRERFGDSSFTALGLPGGEMIDAGLADLMAGRTTSESLAVSLAGPRLRREGVPIGRVQPDAEDRLYDLLAQTSSDLAHARYNAYLRQVASFADACRIVRRKRKSGA